MIKGVGEIRDRRGSRKVLIIGLERENITSLTGGDPVVFECADIGLPAMQVVIMFGEDQASIRAQLAPIAGDARERPEMPPGQGPN